MKLTIELDNKVFLIVQAMCEGMDTTLEVMVPELLSQMVIMMATQAELSGTIPSEAPKGLNFQGLLEYLRQPMPRGEGGR